MKLISRIMINMAIVLVIGLSVWSVLFYYSLKNKIMREVDGSLIQISENIMQRYLSKTELPLQGSETSFAYTVTPITENYANTHPHLLFSTGEIKTDNTGSRQPARILQTIFRNADEHPILLQVSSPILHLQELRLAILKGVAYLYLTLFTLILIINFLVIQYNMSPLYALLRWMNEFDLKHNNALFRYTTRVREFQQLNEAANQQVGRMKQLYDQQRQFVDNAAHEMQTPLAVCLNQLERIQQKTDLTEELQADLYKIQRPLKRLGRLQRDLLQLTRIENGAYFETSEVNIETLIHVFCEDLQEVFEYKNLHLQLPSPHPLFVTLNEQLAEQLIGNLLRNAWVHTAAEGQIRIDWDARQLQILNSGEKTLDPERIFERFYQAERTEHSNGLGLAICRSVCEQYNFRLTYDYTNGMHRFTLRFQNS